MLRKIRLIFTSYNCYRILQNNIQLPCKKILPIIPSAVKFRLNLISSIWAAPFLISNDTKKNSCIIHRRNFRNKTLLISSDEYSERFDAEIIDSYHLLGRESCSFATIMVLIASSRCHRRSSSLAR